MANSLELNHRSNWVFFDFLSFHLKFRVQSLKMTYLTVYGFRLAAKLNRCRRPDVLGIAQQMAIKRNEQRDNYAQRLNAVKQTTEITGPSRTDRDKGPGSCAYLCISWAFIVIVAIMT